MTAGNVSAVRVRRMRPEDVPRVMEIAASLPDVPQWPEAAYAAALAPSGALKRIVLVASGAHGITGFAVASLLAAQADLEFLAVAKTAQRQGMGRLLLEALVGELLAAGAEELFLEVRASNQPALGLYQQIGFEETDRRPRYYTNPLEDAVLMRLCLRQPEV